MYNRGNKTFGGIFMDDLTSLPVPDSSGLAGQPLAARMRPLSLDEFAGQKHLLGEGKVLRRLIASDTVSSMIFWGPPGVGKTTLARIIATASTKRSRMRSFPSSKKAALS